MEIRIISTESLGVRGMCVLVETGRRRILIDPGIALGLVRHKLQPHPRQVERGREVRNDIVNAFKDATDIVFSHYHGDHVPLAEANPYQLPLSWVSGALRNRRLWGLNAGHANQVMSSRAKDIEEAAGCAVREAEDVTDGELRFSVAVPHGTCAAEENKVVMTRIEESGRVFVHASDIQLTEREPVRKIIDWRPTEVFVSGPPLHLEKISLEMRSRAWENALALAEAVDTLIIDHHLLRSWEGVEWLDELREKAHRPVVCAADYNNVPRLFLEADRTRLYEENPVPAGWHEAYGRQWRESRSGGR